MMVLHTGLAAFVAGSFFVASSYVAENNGAPGTREEWELEDKEEAARRIRIAGYILLGLAILVIALLIANAIFESQTASPADNLTSENMMSVNI